jgi:hypothetical protein
VVRKSDQFLATKCNAFDMRSPLLPLTFIMRVFRQLSSLCCACLGLIALFLTASASTVAQPSVPWPYTFLGKYLHFSQAELFEMKQGNIIVKLLPTQVKQEVAVFGVVRIDVPREFFIARVRDIENFKKSTAIPEVKRFSNSPRLEDLEDLTIDPMDMGSLKKCSVRHCDVKLPAEVIERFRSEINWSAPNYKEQVTMLTRHVLLSRVQAYMSDGNAALGHYDDKKYSLDLVGEFRGLLDQSPYLTEYVPELDRYLREYSQTNLQNLESFVYWSEEKYGYGLKPVVTITHTSIYKQEGVTGEPIIIASKQIYADHYFEASLGLALLVEATDNEATPRFYLMYLNRSRADALRSSFAFLVRGTIARHIRGEMKETMTLLKAKMEALYRDERSRTEFRAMPLPGNPYSLGGLNCAQRMPLPARGEAPVEGLQPQRIPPRKDEKALQACGSVSRSQAGIASSEVRATPQR